MGLPVGRHRQARLAGERRPGGWVPPTAAEPLRLGPIHHRARQGVEPAQEQGLHLLHRVVPVQPADQVEPPGRDVGEAIEHPCRLVAGQSVAIHQGDLDARTLAADAVLLSKTLGQPVRVQWMRHDEHGWDPKGPQQLLEMRAGLDDTGRLVAWDTQMWLPNAAPGARALLAADDAGLAQEHGQGSGAITQNGDPPYAADNVRVNVLSPTSIVPTPGVTHHKLLTPEREPLAEPVEVMAAAALALVTDPPGLTGRVAYSQQLLWELGLGPKPLDDLLVADHPRAGGPLIEN